MGGRPSSSGGRASCSSNVGREQKRSSYEKEGGATLGSASGGGVREVLAASGERTLPVRS